MAQAERDVQVAEIDALPMRATCPVCEKDCAVNMDGSLRQHRCEAPVYRVPVAAIRATITVDLEAGGWVTLNVDTLTDPLDDRSKALLRSVLGMMLDRALGTRTEENRD